MRIYTFRAALPKGKVYGYFWTAPQIGSSWDERVTIQITVGQNCSVTLRQRAPSSWTGITIYSALLQTSISSLISTIAGSLHSLPTKQPAAAM